MAVFGLPGGAEWAIIALVVVFLFIPGALVFWLGFMTGKGAAARQTAAAPTDAARSVTPAVQQAPPATARPAPPATARPAPPATAPASAPRGGAEAHESAPETAASPEHDADVSLTWDARGERDDG